MRLTKHIFMIILLGIFLVSLAGVSASDYNGTDIVDSAKYDDNLTVDFDNSDFELKEGNNSFDDLVNRIDNADENIVSEIQETIEEKSENIMAELKSVRMENKQLKDETEELKAKTNELNAEINELKDMINKK